MPTQKKLSEKKSAIMKESVTPQVESLEEANAAKTIAALSHDTVEKPANGKIQSTEVAGRPTPLFTQVLAREIARNLANIGQFTKRFERKTSVVKKAETVLGDNPVFVDTSILIDGRIFPIVNSGFFAGTLILTQFVLAEVQHIADSSDSLRRAKGRRGLDVANKLKVQRTNPLVKTKVIKEDPTDVIEVDHKLVALAKKGKARLATVDFNLAHLARAQGVKVVNINDLAQALKIALIPGEELTVKITHAGKEPGQGVGYLDDGTMVVVDHAGDKTGLDVSVIITKIHQTPAGQLFFARLK
jgi:uncharacterized protein YacL